MNKFFTIWLGMVIIIMVIALIFVSGNNQNETGNNSAPAANQQVALTVYKSPSCGCCGEWVGYMKRRGYQVEVKDTTDMDSIKTKYSVPSALASCHTTIVNGYVIEGHIPVEAIERLLLEQPKIIGIALPGMPTGSPGMPGSKSSPFDIRMIDLAGQDAGTYLTT